MQGHLDHAVEIGIEVVGAGIEHTGHDAFQIFADQVGVARFGREFAVEHVPTHQRGDDAHRAGADGNGVEQLDAARIGVDAVLARSQHGDNDALGVAGTAFRAIPARDDLARRQILAVQPGQHAQLAGGDVGDPGDLPAPGVRVAEIAPFRQYVELNALLLRFQSDDRAGWQILAGLADQDGDFASSRFDAAVKPDEQRQEQHQAEAKAETQEPPRLAGQRRLRQASPKSAGMGAVSFHRCPRRTVDKY